MTHLSSHEAAVQLNLVIQSTEHRHSGVVAQHSKCPQDNGNLRCRQLLYMLPCLQDMEAL